MIGLFAINQAIGPTILMAVFLVFSIFVHISINNAVRPLLHTLPRTLAIDETALAAAENAAASKEANGSNGAGLAPPHKKPNMFSKWLRPDIYCDYPTMRRLVPTDFADIVYSPEIEGNAYFNPAITTGPTTIWIPRDGMGISRQEVAHTSKVNPISDEGAAFDENGKITWDQDNHPPIFEEKTYY